MKKMYVLLFFDPNILNLWWYTINIYKLNIIHYHFRDTHQNKHIIRIKKLFWEREGGKEGRKEGGEVVRNGWLGYRFLGVFFLIPIIVFWSFWIFSLIPIIFFDLWPIIWTSCIENIVNGFIFIDTHFHFSCFIEIMLLQINRMVFMVNYVG